MTAISNADQVLLLLRAHLERLERARKRSKSDGARKKTRTGPVERAQQLGAAGALSAEDFERALIAGMLTEEFGSAVANDPHFQRLVDDVALIIRRDDNAAALLRRAAAQLISHEDGAR